MAGRTGAKAQIHEDRVGNKNLISILQLMHNVITYPVTKEIKNE
jgi:hypothetical protein